MRVHSRFVTGMPEEKRQLGKREHIREDNI